MSQRGEAASVGFRAVNEGYRRDYARRRETEFGVRATSCGGDLDVIARSLTFNGPESRASQTSRRWASNAPHLEAAIINGDAQPLIHRASTG